MSVVLDDHPAPRDDSPVGGMIGQETVAQVQKAISQLPEHFRAALVLCEYEQMSYNEIAEVLEVTVAQVKTWLHRGRKQLGEKLKGYMNEKKEDRKTG